MRRIYEETRRWGAAQYADVLQVLWGAGFKAAFTQTGGMCAAIEVRLEGGATLLVTDADESLAWERAQHRGWGVGLYPPDNDYDAGPHVYNDTEGGSAEALLALVELVLIAGAKSLR